MSKAKKVYEAISKYYTKYVESTYSDDILGKYILDPIYGIIANSDFPYLQKDYPLDNKIKVYRGLNFSTKEEYDKFLKDTDNGRRYNLNIPTSWSPDKKVAYTFAVTRPSYLDYADSDTLKLLKNKKNEKITGYIGILLEAEANHSNSVDVRKYNKRAESEILILDNKLKIKIIDTIKRFEDEFNVNNTLEFLQMYKDSSYRNKAIIWLLSEKSDYLTQESWKYLYSMYKELNSEDLFYCAKNENISKIIFGLNLKDNFIIRFLDKIKNNEFGSKLQKDYSKECIKLIKDIKDLRKRYPDYILEFGDTNVSKIMKFCKLEKEWRDATSGTLAKEYANITKGKAKQINQLKGKDKDKAMDDLILNLKKMFDKVR